MGGSTKAAPSRAADGPAGISLETSLTRGPARGRARAVLLPLALYAVAVVALTWPLAPQATTRIPATWRVFHFDTVHTMWTLSHEAHALATAPSTLLDTNIYHPERRTLFYNTTSFGLLPYFAPTFLATGNPVLALNVAFLLCVALTAWTIHLAAWRWTGSQAAAAVAGGAFLASRAALWGFISIAQYFAPLCYLPLIVLATATPERARTAARLLPLLLVLQCLVDPLYVAPAVLLPLAVLAAARLARPTTRAAGAGLVRAMVLAALALAPVYAGYVDVYLRNPHLATQTVWSTRAPELPHDQPVVLAFLGAWWHRFPIPVVSLVVIAVGTLVLFLRRRGATALVRAAWAHAALWAAAGVALPALWSALPFFRGADRNGVVSLVGLSLLAGLAVAQCPTPRLRAAVAACLLAALFLRPDGALSPGIVQSLGDYPVQPVPANDPRVTAALARGAGPVLELPALANATDDVRAMYGSILHHRPLVNGYSSYYPAAYPGRMALARRLPDADALAILRADTGLASIVVHTAELDEGARARWEALARTPDPALGLEEIADVDGVLVFDVHPGA
jgi:hypothetical protein